MRVYLVRHGQTFSNVDRLMDTLPPGAELTPRGREQATAVGIELAELVQGNPLVFSSIAIRAQQTAVGAMRAFEQARDLAPNTIRIFPVLGLQEIFGGDYEMSGSEDAHREYTAALRSWVDGDLHAAMAGGETLGELLQRYRAVLDDAVAQAAKDDRDVVIFSHGAAIRVMTAHACGVDPDFAFSGYIANCRFTVMEPAGRDFGQWELKRWADLET